MTQEKLIEGIETLHEKVLRCDDTVKLYLAKAEYLINTFVTNIPDSIGDIPEDDVMVLVRTSVMADIGRYLSLAMIEKDYDGFKTAAIGVYNNYTNTPITNEYVATLKLISLSTNAHLLSEKTLVEYLDLVAAFKIDIDTVIERIFKDC